MTYLPEEVGGLAFPFFGDRLEHEEMMLNIDPWVLAAMEEILKPQADYLLKTVLWSYRSLTNFRGMRINDMLRVQIKSVFSMAVDYILNDQALQKRLSKTDEEWGRTRHAAKENLARGIGYVSLSEAIQILQRPTYFKQVMAWETQALEALKSREDLVSVCEFLTDQLVDYRLTFEEAKTIGGFRDLVGTYKTRESKFNSDSWATQTDSKSRYESPITIDAKDDRKDNAPEQFSTVHWKGRRANILRMLAWYWPDNLPKTPRSLNGLLARLSQPGVRLPDETIYVPLSRFVGVVSLETPLPLTTEGFERVIHVDTFAPRGAWGSRL